VLEAQRRWLRRAASVEHFGPVGLLEAVEQAELAIECLAGGLGSEAAEPERFAPG
jgi:hypothetical protein